MKEHRVAAAVAGVGLYLFLLLFLAFVYRGSAVPGNTEQVGPAPHCDTSVASVHLRGNRTRGILLALSGGGSRAAYFATEVIFKLIERNLMKDVIAISSVSGGSLVAAHYGLYRKTEWPDYALSEKENGIRKERIRAIMLQDFQGKWAFRFLVSQFNPFYQARMNRGDLLSRVFDSALFNEAKMSQLDPEGPNILLNATRATRYKLDKKDPMRDPCGDAATGQDDCDRPLQTRLQSQLTFPFTCETFSDLKSDIGNYAVAEAVTASASFPPVFQYRTLEDFNNKGMYERFFDGGVVDNFGLTSLGSFLSHNPDTGDRKFSYVVIMVDAGTGFSGVAQTRPRGTMPGNPLASAEGDLRNATDRMSYLYEEDLIKSSQEDWRYLRKDVAMFVPIRLKQLETDGANAELFGRVKDVETRLTLEEGWKETLDDAVARIFQPQGTVARKLDEVRARMNQK